MTPFEIIIFTNTRLRILLAILSLALAFYAPLIIGGMLSEKLERN